MVLRHLSATSTAVIARAWRATAAPTALSVLPATSTTLFASDVRAAMLEQPQGFVNI